MAKEIIKKNRGFVLLFAVTLAALLLSITLGVANIALKEIQFGTSARDTTDAFFAADSGIEQALFNDKNPLSYPTPAVGASFTWSPIIVSGLGSVGTSCANISVQKDNAIFPSTSLITTIISKGYNIGSQDGLCTSTNPNRVERELKTSY